MESKIPETQAKTDPLNELLTTSDTVSPLSQENLSPGNCVAATVFPQEIMPLTINVATVYPKEILSSGNTVARHGSVRIRRTLYC